GDIAEVLLYDRVLSAAERKSIEDYLSHKHAQTQAVLAEADRSSEPIQRIEHPPLVQMFVPGFSARALPLDLTNINSVRYRDDGKLVALTYDSRVFLLSDTDGDGLE